MNLGRAQTTSVKEKQDRTRSSPCKWENWCYQDGRYGRHFSSSRVAGRCWWLSKRSTQRRTERTSAPRWRSSGNSADGWSRCSDPPRWCTVTEWKPCSRAHPRRPTRGRRWTRSTTFLLPGPKTISFIRSVGTRLWRLCRNAVNQLTILNNLQTCTNVEVNPSHHIIVNYC